MPSENIPNLTNVPVTESFVEHVAAAIFISGKTNKTKSKEPAPLAPPVPESAPSKNISVLANLLTTASVAEPARTPTTAAAATVEPKAVNETLPTMPPVYKTAPSDIPNPDAPVTAYVASPTGMTPPVSEAVSFVTTIGKPPDSIHEPSEELRLSDNVLEVTLKLTNPTE
jgi:hypothetical protein